MKILSSESVGGLSKGLPDAIAVLLGSITYVDRLSVLKHEDVCSLIKQLLFFFSKSGHNYELNLNLISSITRNHVLI